MLPYLPSLAVIVLAPLSATACGVSFDWDGPVGSGRIVEERRPVTGFDEIEIGGNFEVDVTVGPAHPLILSGDDNLLPLVRTDVRGRTLVVEDEKGFRPSRDIAIKVTVPSLSALSTSGSSEVHAMGIRADRFEASVSGASEMTAEGDFGDLDVSVSGSGEVDMAGSADEIEASVSGSGEIDVYQVRARTADLEVSGSGDIRVYATEWLDASVSGSGDVMYGGDPRVRRRTSGSGSVRPG